MIRQYQLEPATRAIVRSWRSLTGGKRVRDDARRTLLACSGGADSSAMTLAIAGASGQVVVGHIVHDMRPRQEAIADRDAARQLAEDLKAPFDEAQVSVIVQGGNPESAARRLRYAALAEMAARHGCPYVATAHHADDLLETMLMRLMRGAGPRGLAVLRARRALTGGAAILIRPALGVSREDCRRICEQARWRWSEDATNADVSRLRAALRAKVLPELCRLSPRIAEHARISADLLADAADLMSKRVDQVMAQGTATADAVAWRRELLRDESRLVVGDVIRRAAAQLAGPEGIDRLTWRAVRPAVAAVLDHETDPRRFELRHAVVVVEAHKVSVRKR